MEKMIIKSTEQTPEVILDPKAGKIDLSGVSIPEDSHLFFSPILKWLEHYTESPSTMTTASFNIMYCNTSSSMYISEMLRKLRKINKDGGNVNVKWYYEDEDDDMRLLGEDFKRISQLSFAIISVPQVE
ncbi:MAG: DUF1987 domain-containing protein [Thermonemataceae bacterium]